MSQHQEPTSRTLDILSALIAFPTVSRDSNLGLIEWVRDSLRRQGIGARLSYDATGAKANLFATIGPDLPGGIVLSGHTDVVPVDGQDWSSDPFQARIAGGRLYGRGACDMKGFLAAVLASVDRLAAADLRRPVHLAFTYDEEVGCKGVRTLLADLQAARIAPAACIVGEPTEMQVVTAHKGSRNYRCCVRGKEAHASRTQDGVNAIEYAARLIGHIQDLADEYAEAPRPDSAFDTPYDTLQTALVTGGLARNIVPRDCEFIFGYRYLPDSDPDRIVGSIQDYARDQVLPRMRRRHAAADILFEKQSDNPALRPGPNAAIARFVMGLSGAGHAGPHVSYMTEGGLYQQAGVASVICGPGSIEQAHRPDEYVELSQLARCETMIAALCEHAAEFQTDTETTGEAR